MIDLPLTAVVCILDNSCQAHWECCSFGFCVPCRHNNWLSSPSIEEILKVLTKPFSYFHHILIILLPCSCYGIASWDPCKIRKKFTQKKSNLYDWVDTSWLWQKIWAQWCIIIKVIMNSTEPMWPCLTLSRWSILKLWYCLFLFIFLNIDQKIYTLSLYEKVNFKT